MMLKPFFTLSLALLMPYLISANAETSAENVAANKQKQPYQIEIKPPKKAGCDGKHTCSQMDSCDEALYYLNQCGVSSLDKDNDGIPCESLCGGG